MLQLPSHSLKEHTQEHTLCSFKNWRKDCSITPMVVSVFNFPPQIRHRLGNDMLVGVIPGPKPPKDPGPFIEPLVDELAQLWDGIPTTDAASCESFNLRAAVTLYVLDGLEMCKVMREKGAGAYKGCFKCTISGTYNDEMRKMVYLGKQRWLPENHPLRHTPGLPSTENANESAPAPTTYEERRHAAMDLIYLEDEVHYHCQILAIKSP